MVPPPNPEFTVGPEPPGFVGEPDDSTAPVLLGVGGSLLFLSVVLVTTRLWYRLRPVSHLYWDDWTALSATVLAIVNYIVLSVSVLNGLGHRAVFVPLPRRKTASELLFVGQVIWYWSITLVKLSVALLLFRIKRSSASWRIFLTSIMAILIAAVVVQTIFQFTQCRPFAVYWDPSLFIKGNVKCFSRGIINGNIVVFSSVQIAIDILFSFTPITFISRLKRPRAEKVFMCILMGLGLFASGAALMRTLQLQNFYTSHDLFRTNVTIALWAIVEQQFGLIAATIPTLKAFFERTLVKIGMYFYDEKTEGQVRGRLVGLGLLEDAEDNGVPKLMSLSKETQPSAGTETKGDTELEQVLEKLG